MFNTSEKTKNLSRYVDNLQNLLQSINRTNTQEVSSMSTLQETLNTLEKFIKSSSKTNIIPHGLKDNGQLAIKQGDLVPFFKKMQIVLQHSAQRISPSRKPDAPVPCSTTPIECTG